MKNYNVTIGEKLVCPVCGKEFKATDDTKYIARGGFTCDWKCFLSSVKNASPKQTGRRKSVKNK